MFRGSPLPNIVLVLLTTIERDEVMEGRRSLRHRGDVFWEARKCNVAALRIFRGACVLRYWFAVPIVFCSRTWATFN